MISRYDKDNIDRIIAGHGDWFTAQLLRLCAKADRENLAKIKAAWPDVYAAYYDWLVEEHPPEAVPT